MGLGHSSMASSLVFGIRSRHKLESETKHVAAIIDSSITLVICITCKRGHFTTTTTAVTTDHLCVYTDITIDGL